MIINALGYVSAGSLIWTRKLDLRDNIEKFYMAKTCKTLAVVSG